MKLVDPKLVEKDEKSLLTKKQIDNLFIFAYVSIVVGYGLLILSKLKHSEK